MTRLTTRTAEGVDVPDIPAALERLAELEDFCEALHTEREEIAAELDALRSQGKERSLRFRELLARKITSGELIARLGL